MIEGLHMLFAIFWFGGTLFVNFVLGPATARTSPAAAGEMGAQIGIQATRVIPPVAGLAILLGFLRGTVWGPIDGLSSCFQHRIRQVVVHRARARHHHFRMGPANHWSVRSIYRNIDERRRARGSRSTNDSARVNRTDRLLRGLQHDDPHALLPLRRRWHSARTDPGRGWWPAAHPETAPYAMVRSCGPASGQTSTSGLRMNKRKRCQQATNATKTWLSNPVTWHWQTSRSSPHRGH